MRGNVERTDRWKLIRAIGMDYFQVALSGGWTALAQEFECQTLGARIVFCNESWAWPVASYAVLPYAGFDPTWSIEMRCWRDRVSPDELVAAWQAIPQLEPFAFEGLYLWGLQWARDDRNAYLVDTFFVPLFNEALRRRSKPEPLYVTDDPDE